LFVGDIKGETLACRGENGAFLHGKVHFKSIFVDMCNFCSSKSLAVL